MDGREIARDLGLWGELREAEDEPRAERVQRMLRLDMSPRLVVEGPAPMARRGPGKTTWRTRLAYDARNDPWFPENIVDAARRRVEELAAAGAIREPRVGISVEYAEETPAGRAFPSRGRFAAAARRALEGKRAGVKFGAPGAAREQGGIDWEGVKALVAQEDRYDDQNGVAGETGSRVSRLVIVVTEYREERGRGIAERLGLPPRSVVDLPDVGGSRCGQACLAYALGTVDQRKKYAQPARVRALANMAAQVAEKIGVAGAMTLSDFDAFVAANPARPVVIMQDRGTVLYHAAAPGNGAKDVIYLLLHGEHYYNIVNIDNFTRATRDTKSQWCYTCLASMPRWHACVDTCNGCRRVFRDAAERAAHVGDAGGARCGECNFRFDYAGCAEYHRCRRYLCLACRDVLPLERKPGGMKPHVCGETYCARCNLAEPPGAPHRCYIKNIRVDDAEKDEDVDPEEDEPAPAPARAPEIWAFDIECTLEHVQEGAVDSTHTCTRVCKPNCEYARASASAARDAAPAAEPTAVHEIAVVVAARLYSDEVVVFRGATAENDFLKWIDSFRRTTTLVAHNGASYDAFMLLAAARRRRLDLPSRLIMNGAKLMYMKYKKARVIDSMRHVAGSLERAAKAFGLALKKSFFPYRFYTPENRGYTGDLPPREWFDPDKMPEERLCEFKKWYKARRGEYYRGLYGRGEEKPYTLEDECVRYCIQDVEILRAMLERYRNSAILSSGLDPLKSATIAGYVMRVYRANHMPPRSIPILTRAEYDFARRGLFGGRTDARQALRHWTPSDVAAGYYAEYADVHSMYPSVQMTAPLPAGAPWWGDAIEGASECAEWIRGLEARGECAMVECEVECPLMLHHPVLLEQRAGRLVAALDITRGVFTSVELALALDNGYEVHRITRALVSRTSRELFRSFIEKYYAAKERHSKGGPDPNPSACALAKITITSLWGKFGQRDNGGETRLYTSESAWNAAVGAFNRGELAELTVHDATEGEVLATSVREDSENLHLDATNVFLAAFVTAHARVKLYTQLAILGERVLYHDTDSIIYERVPGAPSIPIGPGLGEWGLEYTKPITDFVALGPKTYALECRDASGNLELDADGNEMTVVKSKGFATGFTFEDYRRLASSYFEGAELPPLEQAKMQFVRTAPLGASPGTMTTRYEAIKKLSVSLQKVVVVNATYTLPHGHLLTWE